MIQFFLTSVRVLIYVWVSKKAGLMHKLILKNVLKHCSSVILSNKTEQLEPRISPEYKVPREYAHVLQDIKWIQLWII